MKYKVFVDGQEGTTGLQIRERLAARHELEILSIDPQKRKDAQARRALFNAADLVFLCLPDEAAREALTLIDNPATRVIDASTAHRTDPDWVYGFPELNRQQRSRIRAAQRVCVPGCHATGFTAIIHPLIQAGFIAAAEAIVSYSVSGYSGGGKKLIAAYEPEDDAQRDERLKSPRFYALHLNHKHLPEMQKMNNLAYPPLFTPMVGDYYQGMLVAVPLIRRAADQDRTAGAAHKILSEHYAQERFVRVMPLDDQAYLDQGYLDATACNHSNRLEIFAFGEKERMLLVARLDNLGKGASGAAVQNMNIMLGLDEGAGLEIR
ncbi:MAG: N-acetyl-gamma-glutamyl-phosphate reductase [Peptococcaceae bacterium]|nr:N-acetyl-gamma-glutamyl-phosphate reductase [Peptococcaceae bacterium]